MINEFKVIIQGRESSSQEFFNLASIKCSDITTKRIDKDNLCDIHLSGIIKPVYKIIGIMGKSGSGKSSIIKALKEKFSLNAYFPEEVTTRPKRANETNENYNFIDKSYTINYRDYLCTSKFNEDWFYGIPISDFNKNNVNIIPLNAQYYEQLFNRNDVRLTTIYLDVSEESLMARQEERLGKLHTIEEVRDFLNTYDKRCIQDEKDFSEPRLYNLILSNNTGKDFNKNIDTIIDLINKEANRTIWLS